MKTWKLARLHAGLMAVALALTAPSAVLGQQQGNLFSGTNALLKSAQEADAPLLSPDNYSTADAAYQKAQDYARRGRADKASKELEKVDAALNKALEVSRLGKVTFATTLKTRGLAVAAEAAKFEPELWQRAEEQFATAARALETGNVRRATDRSSKATGYYSEAELAAIKTAIVGTARRLIAAGEERKVYKQAPDSLNKAKALVARAEASLDKQRYAAEGPIALAAEAEYEARHADYLATQIRRLEDKDITAEQLILAWEKPVQQVAAALDVTTDVSAGYEKSAAAATAMAQNLTAANAEMTARVAELEQRVGGQERIVEETQRLNRQLAQVEALFNPSQAQVVRVGNDLVLRLVGLSFPSGQSVIETRYYGLLRNVQRAIEVFPDAPIGIEGHTDSVGSDALNMKLSQDRADSVREYLIANLGLPESRVTAFGYGKTRPIASNETADGRERNRRIDVVIRDARVRKSG
jgi:outer membrane protein OmpA-like peptidoglycan-associated protein